MCSALESLVKGRCLVSDRDRLPSFKTGFHHTALVVRATLIAVFVAQVNFHSRYMVAESDQGIFHYVTVFGSISVSDGQSRLSRHPLRPE
jgi:hypothetical protein